jgi:hypothetical protein
MADQTDNDMIDRDAEVHDVPYDKLREMLGDYASDDADVAFGEGLGGDGTVAVDKAVPLSTGVDLLEKADAEQRAEAKVDLTKADDPPKDETAETTKKTGDEPVEKTVEAQLPSEIDTLLADVPAEKQEAIRARLTEAEALAGLFTGRETELARFGTKPAEAMKRLIEINDYANKNPAEYLAWAAGQLAPEKAVDALTAAAEKLGLKVVQADPEDEDPFEDPDKKALRLENAQLKRQLAPAPVLGPDSPQHRAQQELTAFMAQSPHFDVVGAQVAALSQVHQQTTGKPVTIDDVKRFYDGAVVAAGLTNPATQTNSAAQTQKPVTQQPQTQAAPAQSAIDRAKAASKSQDGSGPGASRRPALDPNASIEEILRAQINGG